MTLLVIYNKFSFPFVFFFIFKSVFFLFAFTLFIEFASFFFLIFCLLNISMLVQLPSVSQGTQHTVFSHCVANGVGGGRGVWIMLSQFRHAFLALHQVDAVDLIPLWFYLLEHECPPLSNHTNDPSNRTVDWNAKKMGLIRSFE